MNQNKSKVGKLHKFINAVKRTFQKASKFGGGSVVLFKSQIFGLSQVLKILVQISNNLFRYELPRLVVDKRKAGPLMDSLAMNVPSQREH